MGLRNRAHTGSPTAMLRSEILFVPALIFTPSPNDIFGFSRLPYAVPGAIGHKECVIHDIIRILLSYEGGKKFLTN